MSVCLYVRDHNLLRPNASIDLNGSLVRRTQVFGCKITVEFVDGQNRSNCFEMGGNIFKVL